MRSAHEILIVKEDAAGIAAWESDTYAFWVTQGWNPEGSSALIAVSGGADSTALLHFWARSAGAKFGCRLSVVHIHHGLRSASDDDQAFVVALCDELKIPLYHYTLDPQKKLVRESTEMWARRERYRCFAHAAKESEADWILTAHHRDDLVETVFQRLGRGTGPRGLAGIPFRRDPGLIRPFLNRSHSEILAYLEMRQVSWCEDESNADVHINRNWYRHVYLPRLRVQEPNLDERIFTAAMQLQVIGKGLDELEEEAKLLDKDENGRPYLSMSGIAEKIVGGDKESLKYWLSALLQISFPEQSPRLVTPEILDEFCRQWGQAPNRLRLSIAGGMAFKSGNLRIYCLETASGPNGPGSRAKKRGTREIQRITLNGAQGVIVWDWENRNYRLSARRYSRPAELVYPAATHSRAIFDADRFSCTLHIRTREDGDCFSPFGVHSRSRKLKTFFNEKKVPVGMREEIPIVLSDETLAWVPGLGISDFFKVTESTSSILELVLTCQNL